MVRGLTNKAKLQLLVFNFIIKPGSSSGRTNLKFPTIGNTCSLWAIIELMNRNCLILFSLLFICSCDPGSTIRHEVVNKTDKDLFLKYQFPQDSAIQVATIPADSIKVINEQNALGYVDQYNESNDSVYFYNLTIENNNKKVFHNLKDKKKWKLIKKDELNASYQLVVDSLLFEK